MVTLGAFHSTKNPVRNSGNATCLMGRYIPVGYCSCKQDTKERYWGQHFVKWKWSFRSDQLKWPDQSNWTTFKDDPEYSDRTKPKWSVPFDVPTEFSGILGWMESAPCLYYFDKYLSLRSRRLKWIWAQEKTGRARPFFFFRRLESLSDRPPLFPRLSPSRPAFFFSTHIPFKRLLRRLWISVITIIPRARMGSESIRPHGLLTQRPCQAREIIVLVKSN